MPHSLQRSTVASLPGVAAVVCLALVGCGSGDSSGPMEDRIRALPRGATIGEVAKTIPDPYLQFTANGQPHRQFAEVVAKPLATWPTGGVPLAELDGSPSTVLVVHLHSDRGTAASSGEGDPPVLSSAKRQADYGLIAFDADARLLGVTTFAVDVHQ